MFSVSVIRFPQRNPKVGKSVDVESATSRVTILKPLRPTNSEFRGVFRAARLLGLFPVNGLNSRDSSDELTFRHANYIK